MRHLVVGTAGHIDHGKSALVRALTGTDPDRLKEEKLRGITIDLGFADTELKPGKILSFVDVPGHERFVRHMVAGATGIGAVLLVVAADDGVRPQTREHVAICTLLGIRQGVVALTKSDLVDADLLEVVALELREFLAGSFLEGAPVVPVSSRTGAGLEGLRDAISALFDVVPALPSAGVPRLPVDRSFVLHGFGTVVTGTLASGTLREGDAVEVLPGKRSGRVRGLQVHHRQVAEVRAGQRAAVNLQGLDHRDVVRGSTVTVPGALLTTRRIWARVRLLDPASAETVRKGGDVRFHQGTCERAARVRFLGEVARGEADAEIRLDGDTVLLPGDRFILRYPAPVDTIGGGTVADVRPPVRRAGRTAGFRLDADDPGEPVLVRLARSGLAGRDRAGLAAELGLTPEDLEARARLLAGEGRVAPIAGRWFDARVLRGLETKLLEALGAYHAKEPLRVGMPREELRGRVAREMPQESWRSILETLSRQGNLRLEGDRVALAAHAVVLSEREQALADAIEAQFRDAGLDPPDGDAVVRGERDEKGAALLELLVARGRLVRIKDGRLFHAGALEALRAKLREYARRSRTIDVAEFKQLAGVTRKNAIPLLEQFDAERTTRRQGNSREILV